MNCQRRYWQEVFLSGGSEWLQLTRGSDITEAFHAAHVFEDKAERVMEKYYVGPAQKPRMSPFTFEKNGFYMTLKSKVRDVLREQGTEPTFEILLWQDSLALAFLILLATTALTGKLISAVMAGVVLGLCTACAHNFMHQKDTFRRFYLGLTPFSSREWRVMHFLSHHLHTNTHNDFECQTFFPWLDWNPREEKIFIHKYLAPVYYHIFVTMAGPIFILNKMAWCISGEDKPRWEDFIPLAELAFLLSTSDCSLLQNVAYFVLIQGISSYWISFAAMSTSHHHPSLYHAGDYLPEETDWGLRQLDATR